MVYGYSETGKRSPRRRFVIVNLFKILGGVLVLILVVEALGILVANFTVKPVVAKWGTIEKGIWADALFLRNESLFIAPISGDLTLKATDGVRAPRGEIAAIINATDPDVNSALQIQLQKLNQDTKSLQTDLKRIQMEISVKRSKLSNTAKKSALFRLLREDLTSLEQEKTQILRNIEHNRQAIQPVVSKLNSGQAGTTFIVVNQPGYLFYHYDEGEGKLNPDRFSEITAADFNSNYPVKSPGKHIETGEIIGKVINPFQQIIAVIIDPRQTGTPKNGDLWWFKNGESTFECSVVNQTRLADGKIILGLEDTAMPPGLMTSRRAKIFVIFKRVSGIIVPVQVLFKRGQDMVVKVVKEDGFKEEKVVVKENNGVKAIIDGIEFGTTIISR